MGELRGACTRLRLVSTHLELSQATADLVHIWQRTSVMGVPCVCQAQFLGL